ncbi:MAG: NHLP bacteriocin export ABC transporter permease/ATPase subunit [Acidobacteria bacterium]|nr:NHLP bacteriocin export ABC transporter permease/ATPase subunit [Acidobacteriota bacterium]
MSSHPDTSGGLMFSLRVVSSVDAARPAGQQITIDGPTVIGRDPQVDLVLGDASVSRRHARVERDGDTLRLVDLNSGNGVWVGSERVSDMALAAGTQFRIGSTTFECVITGPPAPTVALSRPAGAVTLRVVEGGDVEQPGRTFVVEGPSVIGRGDDCQIKLAEKDISRRHARIEVTSEGIRLTDMNSTGGTWLGADEVTSVIIKSGDRFRIGGRIVLECDAPAMTAAPEAPAEEDDSTRFVAPAEVAAAMAKAAAPAPAPAPPEPRPASPPAAAARPSAPAVPAPAPKPKPPAPVHAPATPAAQAPSKPRIPVVAPTADVGNEDFSQTVVIQIPQELRDAVAAASGSGRFEDEGEAIEASGHKPFLLDDPNSVWYVAQGGVLIFTVAIENGQPVGTRTHFLGVLPGQAIFGFDLQRYGVGSGFLAVGKQGTVVRRIPLARLQQIASTPGRAGSVATLVDIWVAGLTKALVADQVGSKTTRRAIGAKQRVDLDSSTRATAAGEVLWVELESGSVLYNDMATPVFTHRTVPFPITPDSWIQPVSDEFGPLSVEALRTADLAGKPTLWRGLDAFHAVLCECEFIAKKLSTVDEYLRLQDKASHSDAARAAAMDAIGSVLSTEGSTPREFMVQGDEAAILEACRLVGETIGITVREHPGKQEGLSFEQQVLAIASASGFRTRVVALRDDWMRSDNGPLLGQWAESNDPVALLQKSPRAYECLDPKTGKRVPVTPKLAEQLSGFAYTFYRPFPEGELTVSKLVRFGAQGIRNDLMWVVYMALIVGVFGTVTPFITGQVFDSAIPQADRSALVLLGIALLASALASSAFKLTQGIATIRVQRKMAAPIQSAVWDRILNLPVNFFRKYSAGDLSDRAEGVSAIQDLVSGAGIAAILGSISGLFYVVQMFAYHSSLAMLAVVLTLLYVGVNTGANYLQLRYQRVEFQMRGRITGLVLNLLTGVTKLRVCGAEQHAFRIWAEQFASQRRITFKVGNIRNVALVFGSVFPVVSSIAIFYTLLTVQQGADPNEPGLTTGEFIAFNTAYGLFLAAMQALGDASLSLLKVVPIYERFKPILETKPEVDQSKAFPGKLEGAIELSRVSFRYDTDGPWIVRDISFKINPGEFVAFVGSSGGGKSTLMRLMLGFETPTSGAVLYDGQDLSALDLRMVRQQLGVVLQASRVMPTEIFRNIVGVTSRTLEEAWEAAERASLAEDIRAMPMGMHTYVSEGGGTLSGGQRQRLMIARAIVNKPKILFLDEATSALDNRAQAVVTESMDRMDSTRIVIAHRLSTIVNANRIFFLHGGQIAESGTYQELMEKDGLFAQLAKRQMA